MTPEDFSESPELRADLGRLASDLAGGPVDLSMLRSQVDRRARLIRVRRGAAAAVAVAAVGLAYPAYAAVAAQNVAQVKLAPVSPHGRDLVAPPAPTSTAAAPVASTPAPTTAATTASPATVAVAPPVKKPPAAPLKVWIIANRITVYVGQPVTFTLGWSDGDGKFVGDAYNLGSTGLGAEQITRGPCYTGANSGQYAKQGTFDKPGVFQATYQVTTDACSGNEDRTAAITITVLPAPTPTDTPTPTNTPTTAPPVPPGTAVG